ncbi:DUF5326 family protein [Streptomyces sp. NPDC049555]|uniref:DUF5326 family protein n=1 Tax=unclassified Streptomyces TaxID=2593676 RepID=UPI003421FCD7
MSEKGFFAGLPWWVTLVVLPALVVLVFGGLILSLLGFVINLLFKVLLLVALVGGLIFLVKKFTSSSSSRGDW